MGKTYVVQEDEYARYRAEHWRKRGQALPSYGKSRDPAATMKGAADA